MWALDEHEMCVCDLAVLLNMTKSAISHQLRTLREANLCENRREGKIVYYSLPTTMYASFCRNWSYAYQREKSRGKVSCFPRLYKHKKKEKLNEPIDVAFCF